MTDFESIRAVISPELKRLEEIISLSLSSSNHLLNEIVKTYLETKGKQIRPIIVILSAKFFAGKATEKVLHGAAAIELLHNASLIHDDVVDETKKRRGCDTINSVWDNHIAVLVGDFFVSNALACAINADDQRVVRAVSDLGKELSTGELEQIDIAKRHTIDEPSYYSIIQKKTASLFRSCVQVGGYTAGAADADIERLARFVDLLGLSFQIKDDIFDYFSDAKVGKPTGNDLREGKVTLPLIYALTKPGAPRQEEMRRLACSDTLAPEQIDTLIDYAKAEGGIDYAYSSMQRLKEQAAGLIAECPESEAKTAFLALFDFIIKRHR